MTDHEIAIRAANLASEKKGTDIVIYDLRGLSDVTDYFVIASADSKLQSRAIINDIDKTLRDQGVIKLGQEGNTGGQWVLLDFNTVIIHVFSPELREYYNLEALWGDAPKLAWESETSEDTLSAGG